MSKKIRIFLIAIAVVLVCATLLFLVVNNSFISPFYIHQRRDALREVCSELSMENTSTKSYIEYAEANKGVVVASVENSGDINLINNQLKKAFLAKGLGLSNYWLWVEDYKSTVENKTQQRVYEQGKLGYNLLVQYFIKDEQLFAVATIIPHLSRPLALTNAFSAVIMGGTALLLMILVWWMSTSLEKAQKKVMIKNEQMKQLLNHVSHDLKTPISLIKAYTAGMKDGIDDGSFLDIIVQQNERMEQLTQRLLTLSSLEETNLQSKDLNISELLCAELERQEPLFKAGKLTVLRNIQSDLLVQGNVESIVTIIENLLSNALKYATKSPIEVILCKRATQVSLEIKNPTNLSPKTETIALWEPFCVAEGSRNSNLSGSGLGLSLVRAAANSIGADYRCEVIDGRFCVEINMKVLND